MVVTFSRHFLERMKMKNIMRRISVLVLVLSIMLISLIDIYGAEKNFWLELKAQAQEDGRLTDQQIFDYLNNLAPDQLLLMGKQVCQDNVDGAVLWALDFMRAYFQKMNDKPNASQLLSIINDKAECGKWRWSVIEWISEEGFKCFSEEEQNQYKNIMKNLIKDKSDNAEVRTLSVAHLTSITRTDYRRAIRADKQDVVAILEKQIGDNVSDLLNIIKAVNEDGKIIEDSKIIDRAIRCLGDYWELATPVSGKIKEELLGCFGNRKKYSSECQEALVKVIMLDIGDISIVPEVYNLRDEKDDRSWKNNIGYMLLRAKQPVDRQE